MMKDTRQFRDGKDEPLFRVVPSVEDQLDAWMRANAAARKRAKLREWGGLALLGLVVITFPIWFRWVAILMIALYDAIH